MREYTDYLLPNQDVTAGELDANYFQHINYLNNYNEENGTDLVSAGKVHFEPMGVFAGRSSDLASVPEGATISVPNDATNEGRALLLLQEAGVIALSEDAGLTATANDIADNPHGVRILEQDAGLTLADAVAAESAESDVIANEYANVIATTPELADDERVRALVEVLQTDDFKAYLDETFGDAVQAAF